MTEDCYMVTTSFKKRHRSNKTMVFYFVLMISSMLSIEFIAYPFVENSIIKLVVFFSFLLSMMFAILSWWIQPGIIRPDPNIDFMELLEKFDPIDLCPDCKIIKPPRSMHCNICN